MLFERYKHPLCLEKDVTTCLVEKPSEANSKLGIGNIINKLESALQMLHEGKVPQVTKMIPIIKLEDHSGIAMSQKFVYTLSEQTYQHFMKGRSLSCASEDRCFERKKDLFEASLGLMNENISGASSLDVGKKMVELHQIIGDNLSQSKSNTFFDGCMHPTKKRVLDPDLYLLLWALKYFVGGWNYRKGFWGYCRESCWFMAVYYSVDLCDMKKRLTTQSINRLEELITLVKSTENTETNKM